MDTGPTRRPQRVKSVEALFEQLKPLFNVVPVGLLEPTAQPETRERSDSRSHRPETPLRKDRVSRRCRGETPQPVSAAPAKYLDIQQKLRIGVDSCVQPVEPAVDTDSGLVNRDSRRLRRTAGRARCRPTEEPAVRSPDASDLRQAFHAQRLSLETTTP